MRIRTFLLNRQLFTGFSGMAPIVIFIFLLGFQFVPAFSQSEIYVMRFIEKRDNGFQITLLLRTEKVGGFAKVQENIPEIFVAGSLEVAGSDFTFSENKVKFIWQSLPEGLIRVSYLLSPLHGKPCPENFTVNGNFSYLFNKEKKVHEIEETRWPEGK